MKTWSKPELTVLVRSRPEEAVLSGCKTEISNTGAGEKVGTCYDWHGKDQVCTAEACMELATT